MEKKDIDWSNLGFGYVSLINSESLYKLYEFVILTIFHFL